MSFIGLGLVNVRRNLGRSVVAIVSMAVASFVVTSLLSLAPSAPRAQSSMERFLLGGDIVLTQLQVVTSSAQLDPEVVPEGSWSWVRPPLDLAGPWAEAVPWPWTYGYLAPSDRGAGAMAAIAAAEAADLAASLSAHPRLAGVRAVPVWPILERYSLPEGVVWVRGYLIGRDPALDREWWGWMMDEAVVDGRFLSPSDGGSAAAVLDFARTARGYQTSWAGAQTTVYLPAVEQLADGGLRVDYGRLEPFPLDVVGQIASVTALELTNGGPVPLYWGSGAIMVTDETIQTLAEQAGLAGPPVFAVVAKAADLVGIDSLTTELRRIHPDWTVVSVRELVRATQSTGAMTQLVGDYSGATLVPNLVPRALPLNLDIVFAILALTIASLIVAANLLVLLAERKREISILRALGARTGDVAVMVLSEALTLSLAGCVLGFWPVRLLSTITLVSNRLSLGRVAALTAGDFLLVCGAGLALTLPFGLLPAVASMRTTCMEALRND